LFVGPPGVGKTQLAITLADEVYGGVDALIRFDMGDFSEAHSTARLTGAPPGYVGYTQGAPLVDQLRTRPYAVLLFDEIEHAHENVLAVLLRLCSEGRISGPDGTVADARNAIVICTSNLSRGRRGTGHIGFQLTPEVDEQTQHKMRSYLERSLTPKFIDRLDAVVEFTTLRRDDLAVIANQHIEELARHLTRSHGHHLSVDPSVPQWLAGKAAEVGSGARDVLRLVNEHAAAAILELVSQDTGADPRKLFLTTSEDMQKVLCRWEL
jgi:ATP-dependent Clp protease ATP-binding subunit ClpC